MDHSSRYHYPSVVEVGAVLAGARFWLPWEREAATRHAIRIMLILPGMAWRRADWLGHSLVARRASSSASASRPAGIAIPNYGNGCPTTTILARYAAGHSAGGGSIKRADSKPSACAATAHRSSLVIFAP
jgi:hypothetical protein